MDERKRSLRKEIVRLALPIALQQFMTALVGACDHAGKVKPGCHVSRITVPLGCICAFILKLPVMVVYFVLNLDEIIKLPVVYKHYKKYKWIKNLT